MSCAMSGPPFVLRPLLPTKTVDDAHWTKTKHLLELKEVVDRERHRMLAELQQNMVSDGTRAVASGQSG